MPVQFPWLPVGHALPDGTLIGGTKTDGTGYQIVRSRNGGRTVLLVEENTKAGQWLIDRAGDSVVQMEFFGRHLATLVTSEDAEPVRVTDIPKRPEPLSSPEASGLLRGLSDMANTYPAALWSEKVFVPELSICLPIADGDEEDRGVLAFRTGHVAVPNCLLDGVSEPVEELNGGCIRMLSDIAVKRLLSLGQLSQDHIRPILRGMLEPRDILKDRPGLLGH